MGTNADGHKRIGHFYWDKVDAVYLDPERGQYLIDPDEGKIPGNFLSDGQTWCDDSEWIPVSEGLRGTYLRRAFHEIGHASACFFAGINVEYVHILPSRDGPWPKDGYCKYRLDLESDPSVEPAIWYKRLVLADLGGVVAEREYLMQNHQPLESENPYSWSGDEANVSDWLESITPDRTTQANLRAAAKRILEEQLKAHWPNLESAAEMLMAKGAISGEMAREHFGDLDQIDVSQLG